MAIIIKTIPIFSFVLITLFFASTARAAMFNISNNCSYTVWAAAIPGGGRRLNSGEIWALDMAAGTSKARIWPRTNCSFDESGRGTCLTGDCGGLLECNQTGTPPNTLAEFSLNQYNNMDFFDISLVDGFNVPLEISPNSTACNNTIRCTGDVADQCPRELKVAGGCQNPCTVFGSDQYCCTSGSRNCTATTYSKFFKDRCPAAYSYPMDDPTSTFTCPGGTSYNVVFCP
ncbi:protein P21-like [Prosopis cineraria]|uniref:protein P21-like n=1 Tax=Prosopis cineraria TaxID=364024 RepID=UPI00240F3E8C|nr:protein P21-like [Prosopis cineraria]